MRKQKLLLVFFFLLIFSCIADGQKQSILTFEEAKQIMMENNPALLGQRKKIQQREFEIKSKRGLYMPVVSLNAQAVSMSDALHLDLTPIGDAIAPIYNTLGNYGVFTGVTNPITDGKMPTLSDAASTITIREKMLEAGKRIENTNWDKTIQKKTFGVVSTQFIWALYNGGKIKGANKAANVKFKISEEELRHTKGKLLTELVSRYYGLALGIQIVQLRFEMANSMNNHYSDSEKLFNNGMIAKIELLHAKVAKNEAERKLKKAKRNVEILRTSLMATLANDSLSSIVPLSNLFINQDINNLHKLIHKAKENNPQLKQIDKQKKLIEIKHKIEVNEYMPRLAVMGNYNLADKDLSATRPDWQIGLGLSWTLFEGSSRKNNVRASKTMHQQIEYAEQKAFDELNTYLVKLYQELQMQLEQKEELESTIEFANEYKRSTEKAYREGFATSTDVVEANTQVIQAKTKRLNVFYNYDVTLARFLETSGLPELFTEFSNGKNTVIQSLE